VPLSKKSSVKVDPGLIGNWISIPINNEKSISLLLRMFNDNEYLVAWKEAGDSETIIARGFSTKIHNTDIMNLQSIISMDKKERTYVFFKYGLNEKGDLIVSILSDDFAGLKGKKFKRSKELNDFVRLNISQNGLFGDSIKFKPINEINFGIIQ